MCKRKIGRIVVPFKVHAHQPRLLRAVGEMEAGQAALRSLDPKLKALAGIKSATLIGCPFWIDIGSAVGRREGVTEAQLMALPDFDSSDKFDAKEKLVLRYAVAITNTPVEVPEALFDALKQNFNDRQLVELTSAIAWENYRSRFNHAFAIEAEGFYKGALCLLPEHVPASGGA
jgi:alkylhydroperoxidase family enzyme